MLYQKYLSRNIREGLFQNNLINRLFFNKYFRWFKMEYEIKGGSFPIVICTLQKGEVMKNETGAMSFMTSGVNMDTNTGGGLLKGIGRALAGDTLFLNFFTAESDGEQIGFSSCTPGKIMPVKLDGSNTIIGQKNAFLAAEEGVNIDIHFRDKLGSGIFGGEGFILQKFHIAAMEETVDFDIERVKGAKNILFGEGLFFSRLTGPGKVWIQTMPISKLAESLIPFLPQNTE